MTYKSNNSAFFILREKFASELIKACLSPLTVHFPMGGMFGGTERWEGAEEDDEEDDEFLAGGGEGSLWHLVYVERIWRAGVPCLRMEARCC